MLNDVNMQHDYINMRLIYVKMQQDYANRKHNESRILA